MEDELDWLLLLLLILLRLSLLSLLSPFDDVDDDDDDDDDDDNLLLLAVEDETDDDVDETVIRFEFSISLTAVLANAPFSCFNFFLSCFFRAICTQCYIQIFH